MQPLRIVTGSVKDILVVCEPTERAFGSGAFRYRTDYSVFDWAHGDYQMPDQIPWKDVAQCMIGSYFFRRAQEMGIPTTYVALLCPETESQMDVDTDLKPTNLMQIRLARVIEPKDMMMGSDGKEVPSYKEFHGRLGCAVVPGEFMFRFGLPKGSSAFRRMREGEASPKFFGLTEVPETDDPIRFGFPRMDYSTKYDPRGDVYDLGRQVYKQMLGLSEMEMRWIEAATQTVAYMMADEYRRTGMELWDGKLEFVFDPFVQPSRDLSAVERVISLADAPGAPDEVRALTRGQQRSKEFIRQVYRAKQPEWVEACKEEKPGGGEWQKRVLERGLEPKPLTEGELDLASGIYTSTTNALWGKNVIPGAPTMEEVDRDYQRYMGDVA